MLSVHARDIQPQPQHHHQLQQPQPQPQAAPKHRRQHQQPLQQPLQQPIQLHHPHPLQLQYLMPHRVSESPVLGRASLPAPPALASKSPYEASVAQALEIARESPDGASAPTVSKILEHALAHIWGKVQAQPDAYVMTRGEFSVFNFFQHRFAGDDDAVAARKRYWDNARAD